jgi:hypothetical protein
MIDDDIGECTHIWGDNIWETEYDGDNEWSIGYGQDWGISGIEYCPFCGVKLTKEVGDATIKKIEEYKEKRRKESEEYWAEKNRRYQLYKKGKYKPHMLEKLMFDMQLSMEDSKKVS